MIHEELARLKTGTRELRHFGWLVGGILTALGLWFWWRGRSISPYFLVPGIPLVVLGTVYPQVLRRLYVLWMGLALVLGLVVSTVILVVFFYLVVTPVSFVARLAGKDFLSQKWNRNAQTYWIDRPAVEPAKKSYEQQF
jgi:hypothetical protein